MPDPDDPPAIPPGPEPPGEEAAPTDPPAAEAPAPEPRGPEPPTPEPPGPEPPAPERPAPAPIELPPNDWPALGYWLAGAQPIAATQPAWTRTYELPSARRVVSAGLQLAVSSTRQIRRASIYIGLLSLGALGPSILLLLVGIGRLLNDPATGQDLENDPLLAFFGQPELVGAFGLVYLLFTVGFVLVIAIGIDAQAIAIALLAGTAAERPLRLWEALIRARQVFWRLLGAGFLVGVVSAVVSLVLAIPFLRPNDTNQGLSFITQMIGILAVTPFAFAATGIVLGDVGVIETLKRSIALFRARKRIALVITLFTLVTAAIQTFAIGAGLDVAVRVAEFLHLGLDQGGLAPAFLAVVIFAFIVAYGSLSFTIAAIVAAPQVAGFLGLTFYTGGLDRARVDGDAKPPRFRWVTIPMALAMVALVVIAGLGLPAMASLEPVAATPVLAFLRSAGFAHGELVSTYGDDVVTDDLSVEPPRDPASPADIVTVDYGYLPVPPGWLIDEVFDCNAAGVSCSGYGSSLAFEREGAILFVQRMAAEPPADGRTREWATVLRLDGELASPAVPGERFNAASHVVITRLAGGTNSLSILRWAAGDFASHPTNARSLWDGSDLVTLIPLGELPASPISWDMYAFEAAPTGAGGTFDSLRERDASPMLEYLEPPTYYFFSGTEET